MWQTKQKRWIDDFCSHKLCICVKIWKSAVHRTVNKLRCVCFFSSFLWLNWTFSNCHILLYVIILNGRTHEQNPNNTAMNIDVQPKIATCTHICAVGVYASSINKLEGALRQDVLELLLPLFVPFLFFFFNVCVSLLFLYVIHSVVVVVFLYYQKHQITHFCSYFIHVNHF